MYKHFLIGFVLSACSASPPVVTLVAPLPSVQADLAASHIAIDARPKQDKRSACDAIDEACAAAGYYFGGYTQGQGIQVDCLEPIYSGNRVRGVQLDVAFVDACFGVHLDDQEGFNMAMSDAARIAPGL